MSVTIIFCLSLLTEVIRGTKKIKYLEENMEALNINLTPSEEAAIRKLVDAAEVSGPRVAEYVRSTSLFADTPLL